MKLTLSPTGSGNQTPFIIDVPDNPRLEAEVLIGRAQECDVQLEQPFVSRHHCGIVIDRAARSVHIRDLQSRNGTFVNDQPITGPCEVHDGDTVTIGFLPLKIEFSGGSSVWDRAAARWRAAQIAQPRKMTFGAMANGPRW